MTEHVGMSRYQIRYDRWRDWLLGLLGMGRRWSVVVVSRDEVRVALGLGFRATFPRASVIDVAPYAGRVFAHGWRGEWLVNGSSHGIVAMSVGPHARGYVVGVPVKVRRLLVSVTEPDPFIAQLLG